MYSWLVRCSFNFVPLTRIAGAFKIYLNTHVNEKGSNMCRSFRLAVNSRILFLFIHTYPGFVHSNQSIYIKSFNLEMTKNKLLTSWQRYKDKKVRYKFMLVSATVPRILLLYASLLLLLNYLSITHIFHTIIFCLYIYRLVDWKRKHC